MFQNADAVKSAWNRLGSPSAIGGVLILIISVQVIGGSLTAPFVDLTGRLPEFMFARVVSLIGMITLLLLGKLLLLKFACKRPRPLITLTTFATATIALSALMNYLLIVTNFTNEWNLPQRLAVAVPGSFAILIATALLTTHARELSARNDQLRITATELAETKSATLDRANQRRDSLIASIRGEVQRAIATLVEDQPTETAQGLKHFIDDVVRPLSYRLDREVPLREETITSLSNPRISWRSLIHDAVRGNPAHPVSTTVWLGILLAGFLIPGFGVRGLIALIPHLLVMYVLLIITRALWNHVPKTWSDSARSVLFSLVIFTYTLAPLGLSKALTGYDFFAVTAITGWLVLNFFITWTIAAMFAVQESLAETNARLTQSVDELKREVISTNNQLRLVQKRASRILHGPVQEAITASLLRVNTSGAGLLDADNLEALKSRISNALDRIGQPTVSTEVLNTSLADLVELWEDVVTIHIDISEQSRRYIQSDSVACSALIELIREACGNAIRHGSARNITVIASWNPTERAIELSINNDGAPLQDSLTAGLGTRMLDEMCLSWSRSQNGNQVELDAVIPTQVANR